MRRILFLIITVFFLVGSVFANETSSEKLVEQATEKYNAGEFSEAADLWKRALDSGLRNAEILYNLGNVNFRLNRIGFAVYYYESALRLAPTDKDIAYNLKLAKAQTRDKTEEDTEENPILTAFFNLHHAISLNAQLIILAVCIWLISIISIVRILLHSMIGKNVCLALLFFTGVLFCALAADACYKIYVSKTDWRGVVTAPSAEVLSGPDENNQTLNMLSEGTIFTVRSVTGNWVEISIGERIRGFVSRASVGILE